MKNSGDIMHKQIAEQLNQTCGPTTVLDVGCGANRVVKKFRELGVSAVGIDINHDADVIASGYKLPFKSNTVDLVICMEVVEHVVNSYGLLREITRVLKPRGFLYITTPTPLKDTIYRRFKCTDDIKEHVNIKSKQDWLVILSSLGFHQYSKATGIERDIIQHFARNRRLHKALIGIQRWLLYSITFKKLMRLEQ